MQRLTCLLLGRRREPNSKRMLLVQNAFSTHPAVIACLVLR
jgi:hypothetical protein